MARGRVSNFHADIQAFAKKVNRTLEQTYRGIAFHLFSLVIHDTPVLDGFLRGSWYSAENQMSVNEYARKDPTGSITVAEMSGVVGRAKLGGYVSMVNPMPYAHRVEYEGWSQNKAPAGMVRINFSRIQSIIKQAVQEAKR